MPNRGVHRIKIVDSLGGYEWGKDLTAETAQTLERTAVNFNSAEERVVGLHGRWKYNGLTSLGLITLDIDCKPEDGVYVPRGSENKDKEIVYVEVPVMLPVPEPEIVVKEKAVPVLTDDGGKGDMMMLVIIASAAIALIIILNIIFCHCCLRKQKRRIQVLETEKEKVKVDWNQMQNSKRKLIAVGDALPEDDSG